MVTKEGSALPHTIDWGEKAEFSLAPDHTIEWGLGMTEEAVRGINLNVCKKLDKRVVKVIATSSHVVMYSLHDNQHWVRAYCATL